MGLVQRVRSVSQQMVMVYDEVKIHREIDQLEREVSQNPTSVFHLQQLCNLYQTAGYIEKATSVLCQLASLHRDRREPELTLAFLRKAERMCLPEQRISLLHQIIDLSLSLRKFEDAYQRMRTLLEILIRDGKSTTALEVITKLPAMGARDAQYRKELTEYVNLHREEWTQGARGTWIPDESDLPPIDVTSRQLEMKFTTHTVLVVDDEPGILQILSMGIKRLGCRVVTASNGEEALQLAEQFQPNLIISDLVMPQMDGSQLFSSLRKHPTLSHVPFVCLTSNRLEKERLAALNRGVEDFWIKPFSLAEVVLRVGKLFLRHRKTADFSGQLSRVAFPELLQLLEHGGKTGMLKLRSDTREATLFFDQGVMLDARYDSFPSEVVVYKLIHWMSGEFMFFAQPVNCEKKLKFNTQQLLMEGLRRYDEASCLMDELSADVSKVYTFRCDPRRLHFEPEVIPYLHRIEGLFNGCKTLRICCEALAGELESLVVVVELIEQQILIPDPSFEQ